VQFLKGYKLHNGGFAAIFIALGSILQAASDDAPIDWNRAAAETLAGW